MNLINRLKDLWFGEYKYFTCQECGYVGIIERDADRAICWNCKKYITLS